MTAKSYQPVKLDIQKAVSEAKKRPVFVEAWDALEEEYATLNALLAARAEAGLTQEEVAERMGTTKSAVSRLEASLRGPKHSPLSSRLRNTPMLAGRRLSFSWFSNRKPNDTNGPKDIKEKSAAYKVIWADLLYR